MIYGDCRGAVLGLAETGRQCGTKWTLPHAPDGDANGWPMHTIKNLDDIYK